MDETKRPALAGMFIGGQVPFELAGLIFKAFYNAGINPSSFELAPIYTDANLTTAIEEMRAKLNGAPTPLQIADKSKKKDGRSHRSPIGAGMLSYLLSLIKVSSRNREEMRKLVILKKQWDVKSVDARIHDLIARKYATRDADGYYHITEKGRAVSEPKVEGPAGMIRKRRSPRALTGEEAIRMALAPAPFPETVPLKDLRKFFQKKGLRPNSASVALNVMKTRGVVEAPEPAQYRLTQRERDRHVQPTAS